MPKNCCNGETKERVKIKFFLENSIYCVEGGGVSEGSMLKLLDIALKSILKQLVLFFNYDLTPNPLSGHGQQLTIINKIKAIALHWSVV